MGCAEAGIFAFGRTRISRRSGRSLREILDFDDLSARFARWIGFGYTQRHPFPTLDLPPRVRCIQTYTATPLGRKPSLA